MHERAALRQAIKAQLIGVAPNYRTDAGPRVTGSRIPPVRLAELPTINVYTVEELVTPESQVTAPRELERLATVAIEAWVTAASGDDLDDRLDALALQIETAMDLDPHLSGSAFTSVLNLTQIEISTAGDRPLACVHLEYTVAYHSDLRAPAPTAIFDTAAIAHNLSGQQAPADQPHDLVVQIHG